jgi:hypothetical protein
MSDPATLARALTDLLASEARDLRQGDLSRLAERAEAKSALLAALEAAPAARGPALERLRAEAARNAALIEAAAQGVRAARDRLAVLVRAAAGSDTYDGGGRRRHLAGPGAGRLERRV